MVYESRLEPACLLFADFDSSVYGMVAQPFLLKAVIDYFLITERGLNSFVLPPC